MLLELSYVVAQVALAVAVIQLALGACIRRQWPRWTGFIRLHRLRIRLLLVLAITAIVVGKDVISGGSGPADKALLQWIHASAPAALDGQFRMATFSGSGGFLIPFALAIAIMFVVARRRREALLLAGATMAAGGIIFVLKAVVARARPSLWETEWYWGSSFPSGHTLAVAAIATAVAIGTSRIWPGSRRLAISMAVAWIVTVAVSRLVLGVHWPTDVLAAACIGAFLSLAAGMVLELCDAPDNEN